MSEGKPGLARIDPFSIATFLFDLSEWLFGGSHAGSCGAFYEEYKDVVAEFAPRLHEIRDYYETIRNDPFADLNPFFWNYAQSTQAVLDSADADFEKFKGSNLLGQTSFYARLTGYGLSKVAFDAVQFLSDAISYNRAYQKQQFVKYDAQLSDLLSRFPPIDSQFGDLRNRLDAAELAISKLRTDLISTANDLYNRITALDTKLSAAITAGDKVLNDKITKDIGDLTAYVIDHNNQIIQLILSVKSQLLNKIAADITMVNNRLTALDAELRKVIAAGDLQNARDLAAVVVALNNRITLEVTNLTAAYKAGDVVLSNRITGEVGTLNGRITQTRQELIDLIKAGDSVLDLRITFEVRTINTKLTDLEARLLKALRDGDFALAQRITKEVADLNGQLHTSHDALVALIHSENVAQSLQLTAQIQALHDHLHQTLQTLSDTLDGFRVATRADLKEIRDQHQSLQTHVQQEVTRLDQRIDLEHQHHIAGDQVQEDRRVQEIEKVWNQFPKSERTACECAVVGVATALPKYLSPGNIAWWISQYPPQDQPLHTAVKKALAEQMAKEKSLPQPEDALLLRDPAELIPVLSK